MNSMQNLTFYIGENNTTHKREYTKATNVIKQYFDSFNINLNQVGIWNGQKEKCYTISIIEPTINQTQATHLQNHLKETLRQDSILMAITNIQAEF